jgi:DNA-binding CsgD family transcriptional regulator
MGGLLERRLELESIGALLEGCSAGQGSVLLVEGPAGIGKTALLESAHVMARDAAVTVLAARAGELERGYAHAVVRQLFEPALAATGAGERGWLLAGAAGLAAPVVAPEPAAAPAPGGDRVFAVLHGLYWLTANLARRGPTLLLVDDAHWCDRPSLGFLLYLARRLEGLSAAIVLAARAREPGGEGELLEQIAGEAVTRVLAPAMLSVGAVGELVQRSLGSPDERFVLACHDATGGNPLLTHELLGALARDGVPPSAAQAGRVGELGPSTVRRAIMLRLARLPGSAGELARAVAVLGSGAQLRHAAALAGLDERAGSAAVDTLAAVEILRAQLPLEFVHPIVRSAVYDDLAPAARSLLHARAARLLAAERADAEQVAAQLLACEPAGEAWAVDQLRSAASMALARGAPEAARVYLERAFAEPPGHPERSSLLYELGRADALVRDPRAAERLREALRLSKEPGIRMRISEELFALLLYAGQWDAAIALVDSTLHELGYLDRDAATRLETLGAAMAAYDPRLVHRFDRDHARLRTLASGGGAAARPLSVLLGVLAALRVDEIDLAAGLVERGLDGAQLLAEGSGEAWLPQAMTALVALDRLDSAERLAQAVLADGSARGSVFGVSAGSSFQAWVYAQRGHLREAEADLRVGFRLAIEHGLMFALPSIFRYAVDVMPERPGLSDMAALVEQIELPAAFEHTVSGALLLDVRARMRLLDGKVPAAIADLRRGGEILDAVRMTNPVFSTWRSQLALALRQTAPQEAARLAADELDFARATGLPRPVGVALRAIGLLAGGEIGIERLREAVTTLRRSPSVLELARALTDLGAALRRAGRRAEAREPLREGLQLAGECGAQRLAALAERELRAAGAKPRRLAFSGTDSLTASELRIAEMAASGLTNQQVAEALFVTAKTVENHLGRIYQKLGIHSRERLADALGDGAEPSSARVVPFAQHSTVKR